MGPMTASRAGLIDDRYEILEPLGEGRTGVVFRVADRDRGGAILALKWLRPGLAASDDEERALLHEFALAARLDHPAIARVHDLGRAEDRLYFTLQHVLGLDLVGAARRRGLDRLPPLVVSLCRGLEYLHARGIVHGDVKPTNVLAVGDGVRILDLGFARVATEARAGEVSGTIAYLAPEVLRGETPSPAADLWAVGVMLFEAVAGRGPFDAVDAADGARPSAAGGAASVTAHLEVEPPDLVELEPSCPPALARLVAELLAKEPAERPDATAVRERVAEAFDLDEAARRPDVADVVRSAPVLGRDDELAALNGALASWVRADGPAGGPAVVLLAGPPGVGKSRLLDEVALAARLAGVRVLAPAAPIGSGVPGRDELGPLAALTADEVGGASGDSDADEDLGGSTETRGRRRRAAERLLLRGRERPTLVRVDDLHAGGDEVAAVLGWAARHLAGAAAARAPARPRLAIVGSFRADEGSGPALARLADVDGVRVVPLGPLDEPVTAALAAAMLGLDRLPDPLRAWLARQGGGNPLFVAEALRALAQRGLIGRDGVVTDLASRIEEVRLPEGIRSVLRGRLDGLGAEARRVLVALEALGGPVDIELLAAAVAPELDRAGFAKASDELETRQVTATIAGPGGPLLAFRHDRFREVVAADADASGGREALHRRLAELLEQRGAPAADRAFHLLAAGEVGAARPLVIEGARALVDGGSPGRATELLRRLRERTGPDPEVARALGDAARRAGMLATAADAYEEAIGAFDPAAPDLKLLRHEAFVLAGIGRFARARRRLEEVLGAVVEPVARARLLTLLSSLHSREGNHEDAIRLVREAVAILEAARPGAGEAPKKAGGADGPDAVDEALGKAHATAATALLLTLDRTRYSEVFDDVGRALEIARRSGDTRAEIDALRLLGNTHYQSDEHEPAAAAYGEMLAAAERIGDAFGEAGALNNRGMALHALGQVDAAAAAFERALAIGSRLSLSVLEVRVRTNLARIARDRGALDDAERLYRTAAELSRSIDDLVIESVAREEWGLLCEERGRAALALRHLEDALALRRRLGGAARIARSEETVADFWARHGDPIAALEGWRRAAATFVETANAPGLEGVDAAVVGLASRAGSDDLARIRRGLDAWLDAEIEQVVAIGRRGLAALGQAATAGEVPEGVTSSSAAATEPRRPSLLPLLRQVLDAGADLERLLEVAMGLAIEAAGAERGFLILVDEDGGGRSTLRWASARNLAHEEIETPEFEVSRSIVSRAAREGRTIALDEAVADSRFGDRTSVQKLGLRSVIAVPIRLRDRVLGVVYLDDRRAAGRFGPAARAELEAFCDAIAAPIASAAVATARAERIERLEEEVAGARRELAGRWEEVGIVGGSPGMQEVFRLVDRVARSRVPVVIVGESGTGKELVARAIHARSDRAHAPFVAENCAAIAPTLLEAILFGAEKGSFTGATEARRGLFELAHEGTLFLDEIADMSPEMQAGLLRVLQEREVRRVGGSAPRPVDVRIVCSTPIDPAALVGQGRLREDLYYRLNVVVVRLPALRDRSEDLAALAEHFLAEIAGERDEAPKELRPTALAALASHRFPGNVRELRNVLVRAALAARGPAITAEHVDLDGGDPGGPEASIAWADAELSERQRIALAHLIEKGSITNGSYAKITSTSSRTALRDLADLVEKGVCIAEGKKKGRVYRLVPRSDVTSSTEGP